MNWLFPGFLAGAGLIAVPVALHFLRRRQNVMVRFPTLRFLGETALRDTRRHKLFRWLTLLLRCLAIALIASAFARPFWMSGAVSRRQVMVVAMDNSMSMQASGRWEKLQSWALKQLAELNPGDQAGLLMMNPNPVWLVPLTDDLERVRSALKNARPGFEKTRYAGALRVAGEKLALHPGAAKTLVWLADEQRVGWRGVDFAQTLPPGVRIRFAEPVPKPNRQAAITALNWSVNQLGLIASVRLFTPWQDQRRITVTTGGRVLAEQTVTLHEGDNKINLPFSPPENADGFCVAMDADDLPADDAAWITSAKPSSAAVLLDKIAGTDFLLHALRATKMLGAAALTAEPLAGTNWPADAVVILRGNDFFQPPRSEQLDQFFDAGGALWIFVDGDAGQLDWLKKHGLTAAARKNSDDGWHLQNWQAEHPALAAFVGQSLLPLSEVEFHQGFDLAGEPLAPLAEWPDGKMALAEWNDGGHRLLLAGFPMNRSATDWPAQPSFVPFVHQAVHWLGSFEGRQTDWRVGDTIPLPATEGTWRVLDGPAMGFKRDLVAGSIRPDAPGLYEFSVDGTRQVFAVNTPTEESDLTPWPKPDQLAALESKNLSGREENNARAPLMSSEAAENQQRIWWWVLVAGGLMILAELAIANRTTT
jgi:hypothetical protein